MERPVGRSNCGGAEAHRSEAGVNSLEQTEDLAWLMDFFILFLLSSVQPKPFSGARPDTLLRRHALEVVLCDTSTRGLSKALH